MAECSNCRFFRLVEVLDDSLGGAVGICRRYAPKPSAQNQMSRLDYEADGMVVSWPQVDGDDWCGEHEKLRTPKTPLEGTTQPPCG